MCGLVKLRKTIFLGPWTLFFFFLETFVPDYYRIAFVTTDNLTRGIFEAEAEGHSAGAKSSMEFLSAGTVASTSPVSLSADTGVAISPTRVEVKVLGTGFSIGCKVGISLFGTGAGFKL